MSRQNKVNPDHYKLAGRLSPDDLARERRQQTAAELGPLRGRGRKPMPPWALEEASAGDEDERNASVDEAAQQPQAKPRRGPSADVSGARAQKKTARRKREAGKQRVAKTAPKTRAARPGARKTVARGRQKATANQKATAKRGKKGTAKTAKKAKKR